MGMGEADLSSNGQIVNARGLKKSTTQDVCPRSVETEPYRSLPEGWACLGLHRTGDELRGRALLASLTAQLRKDDWTHHHGLGV